MSEAGQALETVVTAAQDEARRRGDRNFGSVDVLVNLFGETDAVSAAVWAAHPRLTRERVEEAAAGTVDDTARLARLGLHPDLVDRARRFAAGARRAGPMGMTVELDRGMRDAVAKLFVVQRRWTVSDPAGAGYLWLSVLEPTASAHRVLAALGERPDDVRATVLGAMTEPVGPVPAWPTEGRLPALLGLVFRVIDRFAARR